MLNHRTHISLPHLYKIPGFSTHSLHCCVLSIARYLSLKVMVYPSALPSFYPTFCHNLEILRSTEIVLQHLGSAPLCPIILFSTLDPPHVIIFHRPALALRIAIIWPPPNVFFVLSLYIILHLYPFLLREPK